MVSRITDHLMNSTREFKNGPVAPFICRDGTHISIQAGEFHYCKPKIVHGPWTHVEVMLQGQSIHFEIDEDGIGAYVPIDEVAKEIISHGNAKILERV